MKFNKVLPQRKNIRLSGYDYTSNGYYFVIICTYKNEPYIQRYEEIITKVLYSLPTRISGLGIDYKVLMPTHLHIIFVFHKVRKNLGEVVRIFKALVSRETGKKNFWQRNYYEHIIRNEHILMKISEYIQNYRFIGKIEFEQFYKAGLINQAPTETTEINQPIQITR